jgi:hypothetical protein
MSLLYHTSEKVDLQRPDYGFILTLVCMALTVVVAAQFSRQHPSVVESTSAKLRPSVLKRIGARRTNSLRPCCPQQLHRWRYLWQPLSLTLKRCGAFSTTWHISSMTSA